MIKEINDYVDFVIKDEQKMKKLDEGHKLIGKVQQEFLMEVDFMKKIKWAEFLASNISSWAKEELKKEIKNFHLIKSWVVRQFKNEYNPVHFHDGDISGVGYLKIPKKITYSKKKIKTNGTIDFINGSKSFMQNSVHNHVPKIGDLILFPNNLMHTAYPFLVDGERRSFSFNIKIDSKISNVFHG